VDQEEAGVEEEVEVVDLDTRVVLVWVIMPLDLLEMEEAITDRMALDQAHHPQQPTARMLHRHKLPTVVQADTVTQDYRPTPTLEVHHHHPTHMLETRTERLQQHMEDTHHPHHQHYRVMEMERMVLLHLTLILHQGMVGVMAVVMEVEDMVGTGEVEVVMEEEEEGVGVRAGVWGCLFFSLVLVKCIS
jgi:hypothetical protein